MSWNKVNDDYCDCLDGSDEPGTSACPDMKFYCLNVGHEGVFIHSSYVNDMVCDCCDGSDEYSNLIKCNNTCGALAKEREELLEKKRKDFESGHKLYKDYVTRKAVELEEEARHQAEEEERRKAEEEEKARQAKEEAKAVKQPEIESTPTSTDKLEGDATHLVPPEVGSKEGEDVEIDRGSESEEHPKDFSEETPEEELTAQADEPYMPASLKPIDYGPDNGFMMLTEPSTGCLELEDKQYVYSLCAFRDVHQRSLGASGSSGTLLGTWKEWVGHPEDSVNWSKEEKLEKLPYNEMFYDRGEHCWNGPSRSVKVKVACGAQNVLVSAEEPSRCTYVMKLETPAACHHDPVRLMQIHTEL